MKRLVTVTQGHCPKCGSDDINYGESELSGESIYYEADCNECGSMLHEWYDLKFSGFDLMKEEGGGIPPEVKYFDEGEMILNNRKQRVEKA